MTSKIEISRELAERLCTIYPLNAAKHEDIFPAIEELRDLLAKPSTCAESQVEAANHTEEPLGVVERQTLGNTFYCPDIEPINMEGLFISPPAPVEGDTDDRAAFEAAASKYSCLYTDDFTNGQHQGTDETQAAWELWQMRPAKPAPVAVVLPERKTVTAGLLSESNTHNRGWNACLDKVKELNR